MVCAPYNTSQDYDGVNLITNTTSPIRFYAGRDDDEAIADSSAFYVLEDGFLYAKYAKIEGVINATSGSFKDMKIEGKLSFGESEYYINVVNTNNANYISLPGFILNEDGAEIDQGKIGNW
jgi:uncharacterized protein with NRDE domain